MECYSYSFIFSANYVLPFKICRKAWRTFCSIFDGEIRLLFVARKPKSDAKWWAIYLRGILENLLCNECPRKLGPPTPPQDFPGLSRISTRWEGVGPSKWATGRTLFGLRGFHYNMHRTPRSSLSLSLGNIELLEPVYLYLSAKNTHCGKDTPTLTPPNAQRPLYQQPRPPGDETHGLGLEKANIMGYIKMLPSRQATPPTNISISCWWSSPKPPTPMWTPLTFTRGYK